MHLQFPRDVRTIRIACPNTLTNPHRFSNFDAVHESSCASCLAGRPPDGQRWLRGGDTARRCAGQRRNDGSDRTTQSVTPLLGSGV